jgi:hypothetical protein
MVVKVHSRRKHYHSEFCWCFGPSHDPDKLEADNTSSKFLTESEPIYMVSVPQQSSDLSSPTLTSSFPITSGKNVI